MCGVVAIVAGGHINQDLFDALTALQHRGQDAAGIATCTAKGRVNLHKGKGLVRDVFRTRHMFQLLGNMGIGHVRYPTAGSDVEAEAQPFYVNFPYGLALAHNGTLTNSTWLRKALWEQDLRHINTHSDTELLLNVFASELERGHNLSVKASQVFQAVQAVHRRCRGAYAVIAMIAGHGIVGFRDPYGIRPLVYGMRKVPDGKEYMIASESTALKALGFEVIADVAPGEAVYITQEGELYTEQCYADPQYHPCIFEHIYLARAASIIDKISVYKVRLHLGEFLADKIKMLRPDHDIDVVMPIPDTSRPAAFQLAQRLGVKYREGLVRNRYIGRTFIMPGQTERDHSVRRKLMTMDLEFTGKKVLLVDDSIVRGTTAKAIIKMARDAGAKKVYFASAAPEVRYQNVYGIDMPVVDELIAHGRTTEEICRELDADWLIYQDFDKLLASTREGNPSITRFEDSVFTGNYITGDIDDAYLKQLAFERNNAVREKALDRLREG